eukprot:3922867-Karenia_brevis.AAC.1
MLGPRPEIDPRMQETGSESYRDNIAAQAPHGGWKGAAERASSSQHRSTPYFETFPAPMSGTKVCCLDAMSASLWRCLWQVGDTTMTPWASITSSLPSCFNAIMFTDMIRREWLNEDTRPINRASPWMKYQVPCGLCCMPRMHRALGADISHLWKGRSWM